MVFIITIGSIGLEPYGFRNHPTNEDWTKKLERLIRTDNTEKSHKLGERSSLVLFLHPGQENTRDYTDEEIIVLKRCAVMKILHSYGNHDHPRQCNLHHSLLRHHSTSKQFL